MSFGILFLLVLIIAVVIWRLTRRKSSSPPDEENSSEYSGATSLPSLKIIRASDASPYTDKIQLILQNLKIENRIEDINVLDAEGDLSSFTENIKEEDLILIVLTDQLESQKERIENFVKPLQVRVAEIIVDNVVYDNDFITLPADLRPICNRDDKEAVWSGIEQNLKDMFPGTKHREPEGGGDQPSGNKRLKAVKNHPEYPDLLKLTPSSARIYGRSGCTAIIGLIFALATLFLNFFDPISPPGFFRILLLAFTALGVGLVVYGLFRLIKVSTSRLSRGPAIVVDKRTAVSGGGQSSPASTTYYITLQLDDSDRHELEVTGKLYGKITKDDAGVAYIRDRYLLDFRRLTV